MHGLDKEPLPYTLKDYHGEKGVTTFTEVPTGVHVTIARAQRNLERMVALSGEIVASQDTTFCRNTLTIRIENVREFIRKTDGNHQIVVFGDYLEDLETLSSLIDCGFESV